jgi:AraC-like DNA-binding protein
MTEAALAVRAGEKVEAVALSLGYRSAKSFYRQFERFFGTTPTNFRNSPSPSGARIHLAA